MELYTLPSSCSGLSFEAPSLSTREPSVFSNRSKSVTYLRVLLQAPGFIALVMLALETAKKKPSRAHKKRRKRGTSFCQT